MLVVENNNIGFSVLTKLIEHEYPNLYHSIKSTHEYIEQYQAENLTSAVPGFTTSMKTRPLIVAKLEEFIRNKLITIYSSRTINEMKTFIWKGNKAQAMKGNYNDDLVMSLAIGVWLYDTAADSGRNSMAINQAMLDAMSVTVTTSDRLPTAVTENRQHNNPSLNSPVSADGKRAPGSTKWGSKTIIGPDLDWVYK